jgi:hypothetical protein
MPEIDPDVWSGRAVQEVFVDPGDAVLHQCIRSLIGASAPRHHGYQRACDLISGQLELIRDFEPVGFVVLPYADPQKNGSGD